MNMKGGFSVWGEKTCWRHFRNVENSIFT